MKRADRGALFLLGFIIFRLILFAALIVYLWENLDYCKNTYNWPIGTFEFGVWLSHINFYVLTNVEIGLNSYKKNHRYNCQ